MSAGGGILGARAAAARIAVLSRASTWRTGYATRVAAISVAALVARLALVGHTVLWRDEAFTGVVVRRSWAAMLGAVRHDTAPPLSYLLTRLVATVSTSPAALRLIPSVAGAAAVPLGAALARRVGGDRAGIVGAMTVAVMPAFVASSHDARMYALATTLVMALTLCLWRALEQPTGRRLALLGACTTAALYTQYFAALVLPASLLAGAVFLRPGRHALVRCTMAVVTGTAALIPWLVAVAGIQATAAAETWVLPLTPDQLLGVLTGFFTGPGVDPGEGGRVILQILQGAAIVGGALGGLVVLVTVPRMQPSARRACGYLAATGLGAVALLLLFSLHRPAFESRYASVLWGPLAPLIGVGLARLRPVAVTAVALAAVGSAAFALTIFVARTDIPWATAELRGRVGPGDVVVSPVAEYLLVVYYGDAATAAQAHVVGGLVPAYWGTAAFPDGAVVSALPAGTATVHVLDYPGRTPARPSGHRLTAATCGRGICLYTFDR